MRFVKVVLIVVAVLFILGAGAIYGMKWWNGRAQAAAAEPLSVRVEPLSRGELVEITSAPGTVQAKTKVSISAKVAARIIELPFKEGATVKKGDLLVKLDAKDLEAAVKSAQARYSAQEAQITVQQANIDSQKAQIESQRISLLDAQRDLKRQKKLFETNDVSQQIVDQAQVKVDSMLAQINAADKALIANRASLDVQKFNLAAQAADVVKAKEDLSNTLITSPIDGVITKLNTQAGEMVVMGTMNNAGTVIMEVCDLSEMLVEARIDESAIRDVAAGQKATIRLQMYPDKTFEGTVQFVGLSNTLDERESIKYFKAEILLKPTKQRILSGLTADVDIETKRWTNVLRAPSQAVLGRPVDELPEGLKTAPEVEKGKTMVPVVYRYVDGKTQIAPVSIGPSDLSYTIIKSGVKDGDLIVTGPYKVLDSLHNNTSVKPDRPTTQPTHPTTLPSH